MGHTSSDKSMETSLTFPESLPPQAATHSHLQDLPIVNLVLYSQTPFWLQFRSVFWVCSWYLSSLFYNVFSKLALEYKTKLSVNLYQAFSVFLLAFIVNKSSFKTLKALLTKQLALVGSLHSFIYLFSLLALSTSSISLFQIVKTSELFWTLLLSILILDKQPKTKDYVIVACLIVSSTMSCAKSASMSVLSIVYGLLAALSTSLRNVFSKSVLKGPTAVSKSEIVLSYGFYSTLIAIFFLLFNPNSFETPNLMVICSALSQFAQHYSSIKVLSSLDAVTHGTLNTLKRPFILVVSLLFGPINLNLLNIIGFILLAGTLVGKIFL
ncbi:hypothetical protein GEMRC1_011260 [Eukaryota sp. GEM-RC1]